MINIPYLDLIKENKAVIRSSAAKVNGLFKSSSLILGKAVETFENNFAKYNHAKYCVSLGNGLDALYLALLALDIKEGDEVLVSANTYIATWMAISRLGAIPVPIEPYKNTYNINPDLIESKINTKTKAILIVHFYGQPCQMDKILAIVKKYSLKLVEDVAQAHGAEFKSKKVGTFGDIGAFSFYPTKNLGALGDGGAIITNNKKYSEKIRALRNYGSEKKFFNKYIGINSRLDEIQAIYLIEKLKNLDLNNLKRDRIAQLYLTKINNSRIQLPQVINKVKCVWHVFSILVDSKNKFITHMKKKNIGINFHYPIPPHKQKVYKKNKFDSLPLTEYLHQHQISIPLHPYLKKLEVEYIIKSINEY